MSVHTITLKADTLPALARKVSSLKNELDGFLGEAPAPALTTPQGEDVFENPKADEIKLELDTTPAGQFKAPETVESSTTEEVDAEGLPWDKRIHASSKTQTTKGVWKKRKGVDKDLFNQVKAELLNGNVVNGTTEPVPTTAAPPSPSMPVANAHTLDTFTNQFPMVVAQLISANKLQQSYINELKTYFKVEEIWSITNESKQVLFDDWTTRGIITKVQ
jgi:hypothetical protein